jgi:ribonuclease P protein subunit POP4
MSDYEIYGSNYIGNTATVSKTTNPLNIGIKGKIVDETKNMFTLQTGSREVKIPKRGTRFIIMLRGKEVTVSGDDIQYTIQDRMKNTGKIIKSKIKERKR